MTDYRKTTSILYLLGAGNNPMVGMTVAVACCYSNALSGVTVEEASK